MSISSSGSLSVTNDNSNIYSILSSENNVIKKDATLGEWLRLPTKARSLFGMEFSGDPYSLDSYKLLMPMSIQKLTGDAQQIRLWLAMVKSFRNINTLYSKSTFTNDDLEMFFKVIINIIHFSEGDMFDGSIWRPVKSCAYIGSDFSSAVNSFGTKMFCKQSYLDFRTSKYIDVISNTVILFFKKVASNNPELLKNSSFKAIIDFFNDMVQSIYYFVGKKYSGRRLCNRLSFFVKNVNTIFQKVAGYEIIRQEGLDGYEMCGHGVLVGEAPDGNKVIIIGMGKTDGGVETNSIKMKGYKLRRSTRKRKSRQGRKTRKC